MNPLTITFFLEIAIILVKYVHLGCTYTHLHLNVFSIFIKERNFMPTILPTMCHYNRILITELDEVISLNLEVNSWIHVQE